MHSKSRQKLTEETHQTKKYADHKERLKHISESNANLLMAINKDTGMPMHLHNQSVHNKYHQQARTKELRQHYTKIDSQNQIMAERLSNIFEGKQLSVPTANQHTKPRNTSPLNSYSINEQTKRKKAAAIEQENRLLMKKVLEAKSDLSHKKMQQDWQQKQRYAGIIKQGRMQQETLVKHTLRYQQMLDRYDSYHKNHIFQAKKSDPHANLGVKYSGKHPDAVQRQQFMTIADASSDEEDQNEQGENKKVKADNLNTQSNMSLLNSPSGSQLGQNISPHILAHISDSKSKTQFAAKGKPKITKKEFQLLKMGRNTESKASGIFKTVDYNSSPSQKKPFLPSLSGPVSPQNNQTPTSPNQFDQDSYIKERWQLQESLDTSMLQLLDYANQDIRSKILKHLEKLDLTKEQMQERELLLSQLAGGASSAVAPNDKSFQLYKDQSNQQLQHSQSRRSQSNSVPPFLVHQQLNQAPLSTQREFQVRLARGSDAAKGELLTLVPSRNKMMKIQAIMQKSLPVKDPVTGGLRSVLRLSPQVSNHSLQLEEYLTQKYALPSIGSTQEKAIESKINYKLKVPNRVKQQLAQQESIAKLTQEESASRLNMLTKNQNSGKQSYASLTTIAKKLGADEGLLKDASMQQIPHVNFTT